MMCGLPMRPAADASRKKARDDRRVRAKLRVKHLERAPVLGELVLDLVDRAHAAHSKQPQHPELAGDERSFREVRGVLVHLIGQTFA